MTQVSLPYEESDVSSRRVQKATPRPSSEQGEALAPRPAEEQEDEEPKSPSTEEEGDNHCVAIKKALLPTSRSQQSIATPPLSRYQVFKGQSKVRLLPLGRLRSRKTKNPSLHPLKNKAMTAVSRSGRCRRLRCVHNKASRRPFCRFIRYAFLFTLPFQGSQSST
ncbi:hypothetical protein Taro_029377 [Colocasia esculenta]|uniref:Uncharacterized protein n=1 Tax=Colocasia esculenta TaxID=4460 RepID=A0A843VUQ6_COLES|nr:hypothetical protein [Colocasia esculenta]